MPPNAMKHLLQRKSPRLRGYDYTRDGAYFVTIVTVNRLHLFGEITDGEMVLSPLGEVAAARWLALSKHHPNIELDAFVIMPNHVHGILVITHAEKPNNAGVVPTAHPVGTRPASSGGPNTQNRPRGTAPGSLGTVIGSYKSGVTRIARQRGLIDDAASPWQSRYHDHIIRNDPDLNRIRQYVLTNPARWTDDSLNT